MYGHRSLLSVTSFWYILSSITGGWVSTVCRTTRSLLSVSIIQDVDIAYAVPKMGLEGGMSRGLLGVSLCDTHKVHGPLEVELFCGVGCSLLSATFLMETHSPHTLLKIRVKRRVTCGPRSTTSPRNIHIACTL